MGDGTGAEGRTFSETVAAFEAGLIRKALEQARFNQRRAAERLGLSYDQFRGLYRKHGDRLA
jgi:psp operon transcriptional activator